MESLSANLATVRERIARAAAQAGRDPAQITLVAVTKTHPAGVVLAAANAGLTDFGENRVEEAAPKIREVARPELRWHMVGHVQGRKAGEVMAAGFGLVHSVDTLKLAGRLSKLAQAAGRVQPILLECNVSGEPSKAGFAAGDRARWADLLPTVNAICALPGLLVRGLMTMAPILPEAELARPYFESLRSLRGFLLEQLELPGQAWPDLSMGMTDDFEAAIAEGATLVRIGRALFGERG